MLLIGIIILIFLLDKLSIKTKILLILVITFIFRDQIPFVGPALNYISSEVYTSLKEWEKKLPNYNPSTSVDNSTTNQDNNYNVPHSFSQETITAISDEIKECSELVYAKHDVLLVRNIASYTFQDEKYNIPLVLAKERLENGNYATEEEWRKDFETVYKIDAEYNEIALFEVKYSIPDFELEVKDLENGKHIGIIKFNNNASFTSSCTSKSNLVVYGSIEDKSANEIIKSVPVIGNVVDLYDRFKELKSKFKRAKNDFGSNNIELLTAAESLSKEAFSVSKKRKLLQTLSKCKTFNDLDSVTINDVYLKNEGTIISDFSDSDIQKVFGKDEKQEYKFTDSKIGENPYIKMDYKLFYEENSKVYRQMPKSQATSYNGKNPFTLYNTLQNKLNESK